MLAVVLFPTLHLGQAQWFGDGGKILVEVITQAQGLGALLDKMEDNDHIKLDNIEI